MGLYARHNIQDHTVFSEYKGLIKDIPESVKSGHGGDALLYPYAVNVHINDETIKMIDALDDDGESVLSLAPRANDAGPIYHSKRDVILRR